jgi:prepilin-type N-terminal cleavage/methylation domain-containing protein
MYWTRRAFTLIELLVVIAIVAILAAILFPVFAQAKLAAKRTFALSNVKQIALGTLLYANDHEDGLPRTMKPDPADPNAPPVTVGWWDIDNYQRALEAYIKNGLGGLDEQGEGDKGSVWFDPSDPDKAQPTMWGSFSDNGFLTGVRRNLGEIASPSATVYHSLRQRDWAKVVAVTVPANPSATPHDDPFWSSTYFDMCLDPWSTSADPADPFHWTKGKAVPPASLFPGEQHRREWDLIDKRRYGNVAVFSFVDGSARALPFQKTYTSTDENLWDIH